MSAFTSASITVSKMDRLSGCTLKAGRELSEPPHALFPAAKRLTQQPLKRKKLNWRHRHCFPPSTHSFRVYLLDCHQFPTEKRPLYNPFYTTNKPSKWNSLLVSKLPCCIRAINLTKNWRKMMHHTVSFRVPAPGPCFYPVLRLRAWVCSSVAFNREYKDLAKVAPPTLPLADERKEKSGGR